MKISILFISLFFIHNGFAQLGIDTLHFGNKTYPLQKVKLNYDGYQPDIVYLPNEYKEFKKEVVVSYISTADSIYAFEIFPDGSPVMVIKPTVKEFSNGHGIYLSSFLDTIKVKTKELQNLKLYIASKGKRISFSAFRMLHDVKGVLTEFTAGRVANGKLFDCFSFFDSEYGRKEWKGTTLLITDLYYQKGNATYYFDRNFIILCE